VKATPLARRLIHRSKFSAARLTRVPLAAYYGVKMFSRIFSNANESNSEEIKDSFVFSHYHFKRTGDTITMSWAWSDGRPERKPTLIFKLTKNGGIEVDEKFYSEEKDRTRSWDEWFSFVKKIGLWDRIKVRASPPDYIKTDELRWKYLYEIASGRVRVSNFGEKSRRKLAEILSDMDKAGKLEVKPSG
jgi:hypothetical protein